MPPCELFHLYERRSHMSSATTVTFFSPVRFTVAKPFQACNLSIAICLSQREALGRWPLTCEFIIWLITFFHAGM
jgi:hypothetical protein